MAPVSADAQVTHDVDLESVMCVTVMSSGDVVIWGIRNPGLFHKFWKNPYNYHVYSKVKGRKGPTLQRRKSLPALCKHRMIHLQAVRALALTGKVDVILLVFPLHF